MMNERIKSASANKDYSLTIHLHGGHTIAYSMVRHLCGARFHSLSKQSVFLDILVERDTIYWPQCGQGLAVEIGLDEILDNLASYANGAFPD